MRRIVDLQGAIYAAACSAVFVILCTVHHKLKPEGIFRCRTIQFSAGGLDGHQCTSTTYGRIC